jgi:ferrous iron transport protein B
MDTKTYSENDDIITSATQLRQEIGENFYDTVLESMYAEASSIAGRAVRRQGDSPAYTLDRTIDRIVTSNVFGFPIMVGMLAVVFWITIEGSNIPSNLLYSLLVDSLHPLLRSAAMSAGMPWWLNGLLVDGAYLSVAWVVSVMLPPMAIFFPLFTLLEDFGYLPRVAFNMDSLFRKAGAHGKQALTMSMGFGCNAAGIIATRIIDSPRERIIAILTNNFSLCNGRWPTQILIATIFIGSLVPAHLAGLISAAAVVSIAVLGIVLSIVLSWFLSHTILKGEASAFSLELPPYRPPRILRTLYTSLIDRTIFVLWRAILFALPAGLVIWSVSNINVGDASIADHFIGWADPFGLFIGLNGIILLAYIIAIPANEIVIPTILMLTVTTLGLHELGAGTGVMFELDSINATAGIFHAGGWTLLTGINLMLFSLIHNPCSTTLYTIYKETGSWRWTTLAAIIPLVMGIAVCFFVAQVWRLFSGG